MKISKNIILIGILIVFLATSIGSVSAIDNNVSNTNTDNYAVNDLGINQINSNVDDNINTNDNTTITTDFNNNDNTTGYNTTGYNTKDYNITDSINEDKDNESNEEILNVSTSLNSNSKSFNTINVLNSPQTIIITDSSYSNYFNSNGTIKTGSGLVEGDILDIQGTLYNKNFVLTIPLNLITTSNGKLVNGTIYIRTSGSGSNITGLTIINTNDNGHGVYLLETENNTIKNCDFTISGQGAYSLPMVRSNYNKIIGNKMVNLINNYSPGMDPSAKTVIVLGNSHNNTIANNTLASNGSNCIYLSTYSFLDYGSGEGASTYNNIINNTVYGADTSWCYVIQIMGNYNNIKYNTVYGGYRGISSVGTYNNVSSNKIFDTANTGIYAGTNNIIYDNFINQTGSSTGIVVTGSNVGLKNNVIYVVNGKAIDVSSNNNITIENNNISSVGGTCVYIFGNSNQISILRNIINSNTGLCISIKRQDSQTFPTNITIRNNTLNTENNYSIDAKDCDKNTFVLGNDNTIKGQIISPGGEIINPPINNFTGTLHIINESNFDDYFDIYGNLKNIVDDGDVLNITGNFYNRDIKITSTIKIIGDLANFYNSTFIITARGVWIENINIINEAKMGIIINQTESATINKNNISSIHPTTAYGIYIYQSDNNIISSNNIYVKGDLLTYGILSFGSLSNVIKDNNIKVNGTGNLHKYESGICIDGEHIVNEIFRTYGILLLYSSNNNLTNNHLNISSAIENSPNQSDNFTNSIAGIDIYYDSHNNNIIGNDIIICAKDPYLYGLGVLGGQTNTGNLRSENNTFKSNNIQIDGSYFATGFISGYNSFNTLLYGNSIFCSANDYAYGVTLELSQFNIIQDNQIDLFAIINYAIELYASNDNQIIQNLVYASGSYSYGIAAISSSRNQIILNDIEVYGDLSKEPIQKRHGDAIPYGNAGMLLMSNSDNNIIKDNKIKSSGEYAINGTSIKNTTIDNNFLNATGIINSSTSEVIVEGKKGIYSILVSNNTESGNTIINNYGNFFDEGDLLFPQANTTVNNSAKFNISVINNLSVFENGKAFFYVYYNNEWIRIGIANINNGKFEYNWTKIYDSMIVGSYDIKAVINKVDYENLTIFSTINVGKASVNVSILNSTGVKGEYATVSAKVTDSRGNPLNGIEVRFYVEGSYVGRAYTNSNGTAILDYLLSSYQDIGDYYLRAVTIESDNYLQGSGVGNLLIKTKTYLIPTISPVDFGKTAVIKFTLKGSDNKLLSGRTIYMLLDGIIVLTNKTNSKGVVQFTIPRLAKGNHTILAYFADNDPNYGSSYYQGKQVIRANADLLITNVKKYGNNYKVTIKNQGSSKSSTSKLKVWYSKNKYRTVVVKPISTGKSLTVLVKFFKYSTHKKYTKYAQINYNKAVVESNYNNNKVSFKNSNYQRYKSDLVISSIKRVGNNYKIKIVNKGTANSGTFKFKVWFGSGKKTKSKVFTIRSIPSNRYVTATFAFFKYSEHKKYTKYAKVNYNKVAIESNYNNNLFKFKT
ncbi:right-handed parallel beta-helix repeat-containing protein [Methanobrevibacter sp.]|uniref:right-handed parallel beta-helix repeat-containing protein n=1 Tax=Methanobrevibacter sp. TaxID=66852 RepID=UPI002602D30B|nr:right-handed parallel beta-helix repeat-containing protein [uncultured Methanobrevibacter sp.]